MAKRKHPKAGGQVFSPVIPKLKSRSVLRRQAIQRGKPMPSFEPCWCTKTNYKCQECLKKEKINVGS